MKLPVEIIQGNGPIILGQPHSGVHVPAEIYTNLNDLGRRLLDTDWHVDKLYDGLLQNVTVVRANFHRYVIDANRSPSDEHLYPGQNSTGLVPTITFDDKPIWKTEPNEESLHLRRSFHQAYHGALAEQIERVRAIHGKAVLYDCHSIRSTIPHLFEGRLPDLNIGDNSGQSCDPCITRAVERICQQHPTFSHVTNGRFKGGWTTRHYGQPQNRVHAIQMELVQSAYLRSETEPFAYDADKAKPLRTLLAQILGEINEIILQ